MSRLRTGDRFNDRHKERHLTHRTGWIRAAVLGANDGIISTAALILGVAAADASSDVVLTAGLAGLTAGALSMGLGEYVSVSSQTDIEQADIAREAEELKEMPEVELNILAAIYEKRGLKKETAMVVAKELTEHDALAAHVRDELGIHEMTQANPMQAALASGSAFTFGAAMPLAVTWFAPLTGMEYWLYAFTIVALVALGLVAARTGGSKPLKSIVRITIWGTLAMGASAGVGYLFGINV